MKICLSCEGVTNTPAQRCGHCGAWLLPTDAVHYPARRGENDAGNPLLGTIVDGKYRLQSVLGRGGLGTVFCAQHIGSLATVALKLLHPRFAERPEYRRALVPEARRAALVTNDHCARLLDVGEGEAANTYLAMELVEGRTLDVLVRNGPLPPSTAVDVLIQVADALVAIHAQGLVHCDLSPRNVMVGVRDGALQVKVLDFGIARSVTLAEPAAAGGGLGEEFRGFVNPAFAAPELLAGGEVGPSADLYSFGTLAWLLLTGSMPVDDTEPRRAAAAVQAGELRPWPPTKGVPRRLVRLVAACLRRQPALRPASAAAVERELQIVRGRRRGPLVRMAVAALALAVTVSLSTGAPVPPFLRPLAGSELVLREGQLDALQPPQHLRPAQLGTLVFVHGGFARHRLHAVLSTQGKVVLRQQLAPEFDAATDSLLLSTAQQQWDAVVTGLLRASEAGAVDLSFVVPGAAPLGTARLRLDGAKPSIELALRDREPSIRAGTTLDLSLQDDVGIAAATVMVEFDRGRALELPLPDVAARGFELGAVLLQELGTTAPLGPGRLRIRAVDLAGNRAESEPLEFVGADVGVPSVVGVTGPDGEAFVPTLDQGGRVRARLLVRLSAAEPGCELRIVDGSETTVLRLDGQGPVHACDVTLGANGAAAGPPRFVVTDPAGNRTAVDLPFERRDRTVAPGWEHGSEAHWTGDELVLAPERAGIAVSFGPAWTLVAARLDPKEAGGSNELPVPLERQAAGWRLPFPRLSPGRHRLRLSLQEGVGENGLQLQHDVAVQVLPERVEVRLPDARARFLPPLREAGLFAAAADGSGPEQALVAGPGWRFDPALRPYLRGRLEVGGVDVQLSMQGPLLPTVVPAIGHNVLRLELVDLLGRPVALLRGDAAAAEPPAAGLQTIAEFWWHPGPAVPIGEEIVVEYDQQALVRLRCPLPFREDERAELRLGLPQVEIPAARVERHADDSATIEFQLPFAIWSAAAGLAELSRDDYGRRSTHAVAARLLTPAGGQRLDLVLRTERTTLLPIELAQLATAPLPPALAALRLLPVLAPSAPFAEPVPAGLSPPRFAFRPQVPTAVRRMNDFLLQDREFEVGAARQLVQGTVPTLTAAEQLACVHDADPLGAGRLLPEHLLPAAAHTAPANSVLVGVDFFQAYTLTRLLGIAVLGAADAFRLPLGCELELAAFGALAPAASHGTAARGGRVAMRVFRGQVTNPPSAEAALAAGDVIDNPAGGRFLGLDFSVREWVFDLPHVHGGELLLKQWIGDHQTHLELVQAIADGTAEPEPHAVGPMRKLGVVRGLAFGERQGLIDRAGELLDPDRFQFVPAAVPGVLRSEQLQRDGRDLLSGGREPRLQQVGFRVVGSASTVARLRGRR